MKQTILAALLLASTTSLFAQKETEKIEFRPHWYMQVQGGIGHTIGEGKFSDLVSPAAALSAGYRFTPVWGLRGGFSGWQGKGCWVNPRQEYKFNYAQLNAEATFDIANCLGEDSITSVSSTLICLQVSGSTWLSTTTTLLPSMRLETNCNIYGTTPRPSWQAVWE